MPLQPRVATKASLCFAAIASLGIRMSQSGSKALGLAADGPEWGKDWEAAELFAEGQEEAQGDRWGRPGLWSVFLV